MDLLGGIFNIVCQGINLVISGIKWIIDMTSHLKRFVGHLVEKAAGKSVVTKIVAKSVNLFAAPLYAAMNQVLDDIKPDLEPIMDYLKPIGFTYKKAIPRLQEIMNKLELKKEHEHSMGGMSI